MKWQEDRVNFDGEMVYKKVEDDGKSYISAIKGHPELDAYLAWVEAGNDPEGFWTQDEALLTEGEEE